MATKTVLQPDIYQGTVVSMPEPWESGKVRHDAVALLSDENLADSTKTMTICLEKSYDDGRNWQSGPLSNWVGGSISPVTGLPSKPFVGEGFSSSASPPTHSRVRLEVPAAMSVGATLTFS